MNWDKVLTYGGIGVLACFLIFCWIDPTFANFAAPFKRKADLVERQLLIIGGSLVGVAGVCAVLQYLFKRGDPKWALTIVGVGTVLVSFGTLKRFVLS